MQGNGELYIESANGWKPACSIPCTTTVDPSATYKIGGGLFTKESDPFHFPKPGPLDVVVKLGDTLGIGRRLGGTMLLAFGGVALVNGILLVAGVWGGAPPGQSGAGLPEQIGGGALIAAGATGAAFGIYLLARSPRTTVETVTGETIARLPLLRIPVAKGVFLTPSGLAF